MSHDLRTEIPARLAACVWAARVQAASRRPASAGRGPRCSAQRAIVTSSDTIAAIVNCHAVSERASEPSSKRLATIV
jgi:hypothetical protein